MAKHLNDKVGSMEYDKLIAGITRCLLYTSDAADE